MALWIGAAMLGALIGLMMYLERRSVERNKGKRIGVDGWLLLLVVLLFAQSLFGLAGALISITAYSVLGQLTAQLVAEQLIEIFMCGFGFAAAVLLTTCEKNAPSVAKWFFVASVVWNALLIFANKGTPEGGLLAMVYGVVIASSLFWLLYLFFSKRVKNTYASRKRVRIPVSSIVYVGLFVIFFGLINVIVFGLMAFSIVSAGA
ncbi:MAG: DUF2569 family protein [Candidatus Woesearchaeota archaeon]